VTEKINGQDSAIALLIFSVVGVILLCLSAAVFGLLGLTQISTSLGRSNMVSLTILLAGVLWCAALLLPGAWFAFQRLQGQAEVVQSQPERRKEFLRYTLVLLVYPLILLLGSAVASNSQLAWWALPPLQVVAASLPILWLSGLALRRLNAGSAMRRWGVFGIGLVLGPGLLLVVEIGAIALIGGAILVQLAGDQSQAMQVLMTLQRLQYADPEVVMEIIAPLVLKPQVLVIVFGFIAVFVPLVEELIKPIGVWVLAGRGLTPVEGFTAGVLSGAGYALFENLFITAAGSEWAWVSIGRIGTTTMHMFTTGITGYALASAWSQNKYLRLGGLFGLAVLIHAIWNGLTIMSVASLLAASTGSPDWTTLLGGIAPILLVGLYLVLFAGLILINRRLQRYAIIAAPQPPEEEPDEADSLETQSS
jgi:hypothetical protein